MASPRPFSRSTLIFNRLEISICPECGLMVAGSRNARLLAIAEAAHRDLHTRAEVTRAVRKGAEPVRLRRPGLAHATA